MLEIEPEARGVYGGVGDDWIARAYLDLIVLHSAAVFKNSGLPKSARLFPQKCWSTEIWARLGLEI